MKKVYVDAKVSLVLTVEDAAEVDTIMDGISFEIQSTDGDVSLLDMQVEEYSIQDSE